MVSLRSSLAQVVTRRVATFSWLLFLALMTMTLPLKAGEFPQLDAWLGSQEKIQTWSADFVQTRSFKALTQPLMATGQVWFTAPQRFRWELGRPAQTLAIRRTNEMMVIYPRLKRAEVYPLGGVERSPWQDTLALLEAGLPRSAADVESRFRVLTVTNSGADCHLVMQPKSSSARRWVSEIEIVFSTNSLALLATSLAFPDGSRLRNDFTNAVVNAPVDEALFNPVLGPEYKIVEPLKKQ